MENNRAEPDVEKARRNHAIRLRWIRGIGWVAATLLALALTVTIVVIALVNTDGVHRYLIGLAQRKASAAFGVPVQLENFTLHLPTLSLDLYGIRVSGANPYPNPSLLQVDHVAVGIRIKSVLGRTWYLDRLQIDHPVAWVLVDKHGVSNIPTIKSTGSSHTDIFQLGIRRAVLDRGAIYYNDRPSSLTADLHNLEFRSSFNSIRNMYSGNLTYTAGQLEFGSFRPFRHDFDAEFQATPNTFQLTQAKITSNLLKAIVSAVLQNYSNPAIQAKYDVVMDGRELARLLDQPTMPTGLIRTAGSLHYRQSPIRSTIQMLTVDGDLASSNLAFSNSGAHAEVRNLVAHYSLADGDAILRDLHAGIFGGELTAQGVTQSVGGNSHSSYRASLHQVSLAQLRYALGRSGSANNIALRGEADATATAAWGETIDDLVAHADATLNGKAERSRTTGAKTLPASGSKSAAGDENAAIIPLDGAFHSTYRNDDHTLKFDNSYLRAAQASLDLNGDVSEHASLSVRLQANNLSELASVAELFQAPGNPPIDLAGRALFEGSVRGSTTAPHLTGQLSAENLRFNNTDWKALRTGVDVSPSRVALKDVDLESAARGRVTGNAAAELRRWSFSKDSAIQVDLNTSQMDISTIAKLSGQQVPVSGTLSARINVHGDAMNPEGNGNLTLTGATAYKQTISAATMEFTGSGNQAEASLQVRLPAGTIEGRVTVEPRQRTFTARLNSPGIALEKLQALQARNIDAKGELEIHAQGHGSFDNPGLSANLQIPTLTIAGQSFSSVTLQANVANHVANADLASSVANASLHAKARVNMTGDYVADASFDTQALPLQPLLAVYAPDEAADVSGQTEIHGTLHGPLRSRNGLEAHVTIPVLKLAYNNTIQLAAASPIHVEYKNNTIDLQPAAIRGTDTDLQLQGSIPINSGGPMSLKAQGTVDLQLAQLFDPDLRSSGQLKLNIDSHGSVGSGELGGEIDIVDANMSSAAVPVGLQHGNGTLKLTTNRIEIAKFNGTIGGGAITARGGIVYRPNIQFDMGATAKGINMLYPQGVRETVDANLQLTGSTGNALLGGSVKVTDLSFTPAFDLNTLVSQFSSEVATPVEPGFAQNLMLNVALNSTSNANLVGRTLSVGGSANLQVRGTAAEPVILGRVNLSGGDIILNGDRFQLTGGTVQFINPSMTEPVLNVSLTTTIQEYKIDLKFNGPTDQLRTQYSSDPALPSADIVNLLAFGQTTEAGAMNAASANQQAESLVASQVSSQVTSRISKAAGISQLSISPVLQAGTAAGPPGANLTIQQRVTGNLFVTFSTNVATTQGQVIQGQYQVSPRVAVSATRDPNGGFALDTLIKKSW